jgi:hypothetical protein
MDKKTITIEELTDGRVRVTVDGPQFITDTGRDLSTHTIGVRRLADFAPGGQDPKAYAAAHCTAGKYWHGSSGCDGTCHDPNCGNPADFFVHWKTEDGREQCEPFCRWHASTTTSLVGETVLNALQYGVTDDLRFWTGENVLPGGELRCDVRYKDVDPYGDLEWARCTRPATLRVRVTPAKTTMATDGSPKVTYTPLRDKAHEAHMCARCYESDRQSAGTEGNPANIELVAEL